MTKLLPCFFCWLVMLAMPALAVQVNDLYIGEVAVASQNREDFQDAAAKALLAVLVKNSGNSEQSILQEPRISQDLKGAATMVERFSYRKNDEQLYLRAKFPEAYVLQLLQKGGLKLWPPNRPEVLVLPVVQISGSKNMLSKNYRQPLIAPLLAQASTNFGLPLVLADSNLGSDTEKLWAFDASTLQNYQKNSGADAVFAARVAQLSSGAYLGAWYYFEGGRGKLYDVAANSLEAFVHQGVEKLAKHLASQYALRITGAHNEQLLIVEGIADEQSYQSLLAYLNKHHLIETVYLLEANTSQLQLSLVLKADTQQLRKTFNLDKKLHAVEPVNDLLLHYQWQQQ